MRRWLRGLWWWVVKLLLFLAILVPIGWVFARDLGIRERGLKGSLLYYWNHLEHPGWLWLTGVLYLLGLGFSALYWYRLLRALDQRPSFLATIRAHYIGQTGKYLPGKAWALVLRSIMIRGPRARVSVAVSTSFYEVFATMSSGALLAALVLAAETPSWSAAWNGQTLHRLLTRNDTGTEPIDSRALTILAVGLLVPIGTLLVPPLFNRLVKRIAVPFRDTDAAPLPQIRMRSTFQGLFLTLGCWLMMGASVWTLVRAVSPQPPAWSLDIWGRYAAYLALAYVAGFVIFWMPSGLGVREYLLALCLAPEISRIPGITLKDGLETTAFAVWLLRLVWMGAEGVAIAIFYWMPVPAPTKHEPEGAGPAGLTVASPSPDGRPEVAAADREGRS